ncbi:hypothetical protein TSOC_013839 [Tetrabaena socialis]|uniref:Uncharacterized protein n=1 Tax=Tetrabaena socialis TaxID=47790 RepID=A0A2J7ZJ99_9CHLO|nr:hypothetical protein TSOC_013839 [Tetrabaena socialis]|eukprot:PNH00345.1 hypothetical protein TSOC_013839 [Tetrabaena socialis]
MDLANMIAGASADRFKQECTDNVCKIDIQTGDGFSYALEVVPLAQHVLVRYDTMEYKMPRADKEAWEELCALLADAMAEAYTTSTNGSYHGYYERPSESFTLTVTMRGKEVFRSKSEDSEEGPLAGYMASELTRYMKQLRFLN